MWPALLLTLEKEFRLLRRDSVGVFMLLLAPIVVITVAGFSLANLYGTAPGGQTAYLLPVVDEDHGAVAEGSINALRSETALSVKIMHDRPAETARARDSKQ